MSLDWNDDYDYYVLTDSDPHWNVPSTSKIGDEDDSNDVADLIAAGD